MSLSRGVLDALLPPGSLWSPEDDEYFDKLLDGIADNAEAVKGVLGALAYIRDPMKTPVLPDLETEFGIIPDDRIDENTRRIRLRAVMTAGNSNGSLDFMQQKLRDAGFNDVTVYANLPAVDPYQFVSYTPTSIFGNEDAIFGKTGVVFGGARGFLLVNGPVYDNQVLREYVSPVDSGYWPMVFFVGGEATRDPVTNEITQIETVNVPILRKTEFIQSIIKYKPMFSWTAVVVNYV